MEREPRYEIESQIERKKLETILEHAKEQLGAYQIREVGDAGFAIQFDDRKPEAGNDWLMFDYDDTLAATSDVKKKRLALFETHLSEQGIKLGEKDAATIMQMTDIFSRWQERPDSGEQYHPNAHMVALDWIVKELRNDGTPADILPSLEKQLMQLHSQAGEQDTPENQIPFYIRKDGKFILRGIRNKWSPEIGKIFDETMLNPPQYTDVLEGANEISQESDSHAKTNLGILSYGEPSFQLQKIIHLLEQNPAFAISQVWLTKKGKGDFMTQAIEHQAITGFEASSQTENQTYEGQILGTHDHTITIMDDDPKELNSLLESKDFIESHSGAKLRVVRSLRAHTKSEEKTWERENEGTTLDFIKEQLNKEEIAKKLRK